MRVPRKVADLNKIAVGEKVRIYLPPELLQFVPKIKSISIDTDARKHVRISVPQRLAQNVSGISFSSYSLDFSTSKLERYHESSTDSWYMMQLQYKQELCVMLDFFEEDGKLVIVLCLPLSNVNFDVSKPPPTVTVSKETLELSYKRQNVEMVERYSGAGDLITVADYRTNKGSWHIGDRVVFATKRRDGIQEYWFGAVIRRESVRLH